VDPAALERSLLGLQTSSPSALLLASSAAALADAFSRRGAARRRQATARAVRLRQQLAEQGLAPMANADPLRLVLATAPLGFSGLAADGWLLERGVIAELPEPGALTFCLGLAPPPSLERRLPRALARLRQALGGPPLPPFTPPPLPALAAPELAPGQAWRAPAEVLPLDRCAGRLAAEPLCPYPPGIPLLLPGERIDAARLAWLREQSRLWPGQIPTDLRVIR
jgi:lysine decarboxylase